VSPGEEDKDQLLQNVGVGDVKVVLESGYRDVSIELKIGLGLAISENIDLSIVHTLLSIYSCPAAIALFPTWKPICAVGSFMNPPNPGAPGA
jgi:hypothetical protein